MKFWFVILSFIVTIWLGYPIAKKTLRTSTVVYYNYSPKKPVQSQIDTSKLPSAKAIPILMYHGVVNKIDDENTNIDKFIGQMEMLKTEGYETVSINELDLFFNGKFTLPAKPIIITFDDGRRDSYYPTDDIFKKLGFKATIFVATGRALKKDNFYLSWEELKVMKESGVWEIEAHGRDSHTKITINQKGDEGRYLSSRLYKGQLGLETVPEFEKRVEDDYLNNILDLQKNVGVDTKYIAIPMSDYGKKPVSNYPEATEFNEKIVRKYFRMAFRQTDKDIYNFTFDDPHNLKRLEVKNIETETLKEILQSQAPKPPQLSDFKQNITLAYGNYFIDSEGLHLKSNPGSQSAKVVFGQAYWDNYTLEAEVKRVSGRSVVLVGYSKDNKNLVSLGITDNGIFIRETVNEVERPLRGSIIINPKKDALFRFKLIFKEGKVTASLNDKILYNEVAITLTHGFPGFKVWDDKQEAHGILKSLKVYPSL